MALVGCLKDDFSLSQYFLPIDSLNCQFKSSFLELNIAKTKELVFGKGKAGNTPTPIYIDNQGVDIVSSFKYLGTFIDTNLTFCDHVGGPTVGLQENPTAIVSPEIVTKL